ncbi:hypothetical protein N9D38_08115 [Rubripirellula sp.]|nr:hypothetical protein [Rubripirellula sp.]
MRQTLLPLLISLFSFVTACTGQTTITDRSMDITVGNGLLGVFLSDYRVGSNETSETALFDDGDLLGYQGDLRLIRRFLHTRTSIEGRVFYGVAESNDTNQVDSLVLSELGGSNELSFGQGRADLKTSIDHYGYDLGLRDTWCTTFGGLSAGCLFSYMMFDQNYDVFHQSTAALSEELSSEFIGGKAVFGWDGYLRDCPTLLDFAVGFYQLRTDYLASSEQVSTIEIDYLYSNPVNLEATFTTFQNVNDVRLSYTISMTHLDKIPSLSRDSLKGTSIKFDDGFLLKMMVEILL